MAQRLLRNFSVKCYRVEGKHFPKNPMNLEGKCSIDLKILRKISAKWKILLQVFDIQSRHLGKLEHFHKFFSFIFVRFVLTRRWAVGAFILLLSFCLHEPKTLSKSKLTSSNFIKRKQNEMASIHKL